MAGGSADSGRSVTSKALGVLGAFSQDTPRLSLTAIAQAADLPLSTAHRLVAELLAWGGLSRREDGSFEVGARLWRLGLLASMSRELREVALPFMQDLAATSGENVHIAVRRGTRALYVDRIAGTKSVPTVSRSGTELPLHATAVGKVLLADADRQTVQEALNQLIRVTPFTVTEPGRMLGQLAEIRRRRWAETCEEMTLGASSIAVPIEDRAGTVIAALGVVTTSSRRGLVKLLPALQLAARGIARSVSLPVDGRSR